MCLTPPAYAAMTRQLRLLARGKVVVVLEARSFPRTRSDPIRYETIDRVQAIMLLLLKRKEATAAPFALVKLPHC